MLRPARGEGFSIPLEIASSCSFGQMERSGKASATLYCAEPYQTLRICCMRLPAPALRDDRARDTGILACSLWTNSRSQRRSSVHACFSHLAFSSNTNLRDPSQVRAEAAPQADRTGVRQRVNGPGACTMLRGGARTPRPHGHPSRRGPRGCTPKHTPAHRPHGHRHLGGPRRRLNQALRVHALAARTRHGRALPPRRPVLFEPARTRVRHDHSSSSSSPAKSTSRCPTTA
jgi:hypothetical protein